MKFNRCEAHNHGPIICELCDAVVQECVCIPMSYGTKILVICVKCKDQKSYEQQQRMLEANEKLRKLGIVK